ncbi:MAG: hypothetical protein QW364_00500 [Thermoplasmatales archaeon]
MKEMDIKISMLKCPICDNNHNYNVKVEYEEKRDRSNQESPPYHNTFTTMKKVGDKVIEVQVYEIDAFCLKNNIPFRIIVDPLLPPNSEPIKFTVSGAT